MDGSILVTGAMGQLGQRVTSILLGRDRTVLALDVANKATEAAANALRPAPGSPGTLIPAFVDLLDADKVTALVAEHRPRAIVHLAAIIAPLCYRRPDLGRRVNVDGTGNLVAAASRLHVPPLFVEASSISVYGSRNPYRHAGRLSATTPVNPVDCYGQSKVEAERLVAASGVPRAILRIGGIISPEALANAGLDHLVLMRATPRDNRLHTVDGRDTALAFANAAEFGPGLDGKILLIGGNETCVKTHREIEDDCMQALGLGRLGPTVGLPGDPSDDRGWGLTDWMDTAEAQSLLNFQEHDWQETLDWVAREQRWRRPTLQAIGPVLRPALRGALTVLQKREKRGEYADPWRLIEQKYGTQALASGS